MPLSILGLPAGNRSPFLWLLILFSAVWRAVFRMPRYIVLEVGLEFPGDIADIVRWLKPDVAVLTRLPRNPVHLEHFPDRESLYDEKVSLLRAVKPGGIAVYNGDDPVQEPYMRGVSDTVATEAFNTEKVGVVSEGIHYDNARMPLGTDAVLSLDGVSEPFYIPDVLGRGIVQSLLAAVAAVRAVDPDISVSAVRRAVASRPPTPGRMRVLPGKNGSVIVDDSYNASPLAMESALRTLSAVERRKKIAVLGVMAELGPESGSVHASLGKVAAETADQVLVVGDAPYGDGAEYFRTADDAAEACLKYAGPDTVFLCKGSQIARIERVVARLLSPECTASEVLVRQEAEWL